MMWVELFCSNCLRIIRIVSSSTSAITINLQNMAEAKTSICPNCKTIEHVQIRANVLKDEPVEEGESDPEEHLPEEDSRLSYLYED